MRRKLLALLIIVPMVLVFATASSAHAQQPPTGPSSNDLSSIAPPPKPLFPKLDSMLNRMVEGLVGSSSYVVPNKVQAYQGGPVAVTIRVSSVTAALTAFLQQGNVVLANVGADYVEAYVPVAFLPALAGRGDVLAVHIIIPPQPLVTSQGATVHRSPVWNAKGLTGAGVKVGIIDAGFIGYGSLMGGELPSTVVARCYTAVGLFTSSLADCQTDTIHGTAVAEAVVDMAPNVILYIANPISDTDFQTTASWMLSQGVKVINMSLGSIYEGPGDGTSPFSNSILSTVNTAVAGGAIWVNAAGNEAESTWYGAFTDTDNDSFHNFLGADDTNNVVLNAGEEIIVQLRWDDSWGNAGKDLDLELYNSSLTLVANSTDSQNGGAGEIPLEILVYTAAAAGTYHVAISRFAGAIPAWIQVQAFTSQPMQYATAERSIGVPAESANPGMLAVGAANWQTPDIIEDFSSQGPTTDGRIKPDIVGADRGDSVSYGPNGFAGTSQASPHVAGLAALVLQQNAAFTAAQVAGFLKSNALPRGAVPNNDWGFGLAQLPSLVPAPPQNVSAQLGPGANQATVSWSAPIADGGSPITQYTATSSPGNKSATVNGSTLSAVVGTLTLGTSYTFTVTATNAVGNSSPSLPSSALAVSAAAPDPPQNVSISTGPGIGQLTVSWSAPIFDGGSPITQYTATSSPGNKSATVNGSTLSVAVGGLTPGTSYTFTVTAINAVGTSSPSLPSSALAAPDLPSPPLNVARSTGPGTGQVTVSWSAPSSDGSSPITNYTATSSPGNKSATVNGATLSVVIGDLTPGTSYTFTVTATNSVGTSSPSQPSSHLVPPPFGVPSVTGVGLGLLAASFAVALAALNVRMRRPRRT